MREELPCCPHRCGRPTPGLPVADQIGSLGFPLKLSRLNQLLLLLIPVFPVSLLTEDKRFPGTFQVFSTRLGLLRPQSSWLRKYQVVSSPVRVSTVRLLQLLSHWASRTKNHLRFSAQETLVLPLNMS